MEEVKILSYREVDYRGKRVLLRLDINSPIDPETHRITDPTRLRKSAPTLVHLLQQGAKVAILAHQGDTLDYQNLIPLEEHAEILSKETGFPVSYIDDCCGPAALERVQQLREGEAVILGNVRYLTEEISTFETVVKLTAKQQAQTWLVRKLAPLFDAYVNDAFSAAHRDCPSMCGFQQVLPSAAGELLFAEYAALSKVLRAPVRPSVFVLGGAKISDAFGMLEQVLSNGTADRILVSGVTGVVFLLAKGLRVGQAYEKWLQERKLLDFVEPAKAYLRDYADRIVMPTDLAYEENGERREIPVDQLPLDSAMFLDVGADTVEQFRQVIEQAGTLFINGPAGVYENPLFEMGTREIWKAIAEAPGYSVVGGGDSVQAAGKFIDLNKISYVCTAGGAMVRFMTGKKLPLIEAMEQATARQKERK